MTARMSFGISRVAEKRGYFPVYRAHEVNHCPGCGHSQWLVGRISAECAFCATALPIAEATSSSYAAPTRFVTRHSAAA
ncbi:hypothetical protein [Sphingomicrobium sediminis]|uniref:Uncharacterized protein n=1 Tax=Sphingomicrobium sediminis TaxID=2950949 RepID=A0A9X2J303_9SPHN|nr:hypothetical protein [Sphingomicrobium sediminis]MCM8558309.1 hypothetical protein [Sphingomicrobium sediminis]